MFFYLPSGNRSAGWLPAFATRHAIEEAAGGAGGGGSRRATK